MGTSKEEEDSDLERGTNTIYNKQRSLNTDLESDESDASNESDGEYSGSDVEIQETSCAVCNKKFNMRRTYISTH